MDVYVMGKKWMWKFAYPQGPNGLNVLRVPAHRPVRLLITSRDVLHAFYVPAFRVKMDAVPGRYSQTWFEATQTGTFPIFCAEYCGTAHSMMLGEVIVMEPEDYDKWIVEERAANNKAWNAGSEPNRMEDLVGATWSRKASASRGAGLLQVPHRRRLAAHRAEAGSTCTAPTHKMQDGQ